MKSLKKFAILSCVLILGLIAVTFTGCYSKVTVDLSKYNDDVSRLNGKVFMPSLEDLGDYRDIKYTNIENINLFSSECCDLTVTYSAQNYKKAKAWTEENYTFLDKPQTADYCREGEYTIPVVEFSIDDYDFKVAQHPDFEYPKNFGIMGYSDSTYSITFLWFYDINLDLISMGDESDSMTEFLNYHFSWEKRH